jgi:hypothetical protein
MFLQFVSGDAAWAIESPGGYGVLAHARLTTFAPPYPHLEAGGSTLRYNFEPENLGLAMLFVEADNPTCLKLLYH